MSGLPQLINVQGHHYYDSAAYNEVIVLFTMTTIQSPGDGELFFTESGVTSMCSITKSRQALFTITTSLISIDISNLSIS